MTINSNPGGSVSGFEVVVIGGGVIGLSLAWELLSRGRRVCVVDNAAQGGASWAGAGILPPSPVSGAVDGLDQLKGLSHGLHEQWAARLSEQTGIDTGFRKCGGLYLATTAAEAATLTGNCWWWDEHAIPYRKLDCRQLMAEEPGLSEYAQQHVRAAWLLPTEYQLRNPHHLQALRAACLQMGAQILSDSEVESLLIEDGRSFGVQLRGNSVRIEAEQVCICSGAWARQQLKELGISTGIMPIRGQMILYRCSTPLLRRVINEGNRYLVPRDDGRVLAGSVEEEVGYHVATTEAALESIHNWAHSIVPMLSPSTIEKSWAGLRPGSFDSLPYIGRVPDVRGLWVAAGHFRNGLHLSTATAVCLANEMQGIPSPIDLTPFRVGRG